MDAFKFLKKVPLFSSLADSDIWKIEAVCREQKLRAGDIVFTEGRPGRHFYIVLEGAVSIWKDYRAPNQDLLAVYDPGHSFGELALIDDFPRSATVIAREPSKLLSINRHDFHQVIKTCPSIAFLIMRSMSLLIRERTDTFVAGLRDRHRNLEEAYARLKHEIEERRQVEKQLHHQAFHDSLTDLPNRALFLNHLEEVMQKAEREQVWEYAVLYMDIDRFSVINESFGHVTGDGILSEMAVRLRNCIRRTETLARFSGDEFALLIKGVHNTRDAVRVADRIKKELAPPFRIKDKELFVTASVGIVPGKACYGSTVDILRDADIAMYGAKARGNGEYQIYDEGLHQKTMSLLRLETDLRGAVDRDEFSLRYQPIVSLASCQVVGFETLVRWKHPDQGDISPEIFIPIAERNGVILPLGHWILDQSCVRMKAWLDQMPEGRDIFINVNISGKQLMQPDFIPRFREVLRQSGLPGISLKVEMTESVLIENVDDMAAILNQIRELGVRIAIDDFGTGYSSLSYLHKFPIDVLKIDRTFTARLEKGQKLEKDLVPIIISIARNMSMEVVAEGIETPEQLRILRDYGCEYGQGFLFAKPMSASDAFGLISGDAQLPDFCSEDAGSA
ncbi:hypothetical protein DENIS_3727 [Desulfonema ishimotonii]|uniref:Uncharacterized protein n=1 Tax=Desulfonema ishimotonii TaxID=45657 RepID=A0A401G0K6_9BACT|nr:EAL domain-containing protein [Desulfonema ishimotonii]GBC62750.1 hypothetical protein DENIS_3727 [Desulfonema ishimotonii]